MRVAMLQPNLLRAFGCCKPGKALTRSADGVTLGAGIESVAGMGLCHPCLQRQRRFSASCHHA